MQSDRVTSLCPTGYSWLGEASLTQLEPLFIVRAWRLVCNFRAQCRVDVLLKDEFLDDGAVVSAAKEKKSKECSN